MQKTGFKALWHWPAMLAIIWALNFFIHDIIDPYVYTIVIYCGINIILAVSLNVVSGFTGQFSIGHAGFMSVGAYASSMLTVWLQIHHPEILSPTLAPFIFVASLLFGGVLAGLVGYVVGLPSLRLKGDYLAIVTLGFGEIIRVIWLNIDAVGGARGLAGIPNYTNFGWVYTFALITLFVIIRTMKSAMGRSFLSVREDEIAAESMGVNTTRAKVQAFILGAIFAGIAGGLFAHFLQYINPATFDFNRSFEIIIMVVLGGLGSISGSVFAAIFLTVLREALRPLQEITKVDFRMVIYSLLLIVMMLTRPHGVFGGLEVNQIWKKWKNRKGAKP